MAMETPGDTICAVSTPPGAGGIGIVRLSGPDAVGIAGRIFVRNDNKVGNYDRSHRLFYGHVVNPDNGETADEALLGIMLAPNTYTKEDIAEINCHGGPAALRKVLEIALSAGARLAEPGEFTKRAFLNGRIDLTQAEAVMDVIAAKSELSLSAALEQLKGGLKEKVDSLRESAASLLALTEVSIDFAEEDVELVPHSMLAERGRGLLAGIDSLLSTYEDGRLLREGYRVAIIGRPNVGKSSLLNRLTRTERAIVADIPGTTRDTVEEHVNIGGVPVRLVDTAGIRGGELGAVERLGIERSEKALDEADLTLLVLDSSEPMSAEDDALLERVGGRNFIAVMNKSDLDTRLDTTAAKGLDKAAATAVVSAKTGDGIEKLSVRVREAATGGGRERATGAAINLRHRLALEKARSAAGRFLEGCEEGLSQELLALELRDALNAIGEIAGVTTPEEVLDRIFGEFCIGK